MDPPEPHSNNQASDPANSSPGTSVGSELTEQTSPFHQSPKKNRKKLFIALALAAVIVAAGIGAYLIHKPAKPQDASNTKKDIPLLRVGLSNNGGIASYPAVAGTDEDSAFLEGQLFEGLVGFKNETQIVPLLATSWTNPNDTTWVFNIRQSVKFHSGRTLTAQDVKSTYDYALSHQGSGPEQTSFASYTTNIKTVAVTGPFQVTITTNTPNPTLLDQVGNIGIFDSKANLSDFDSGTGPYVVKPGTKPTSSFIDLIAFNGYWGGHVYTKEVQLKIYDDNGQMASDAQDGKLDLAGEFTRPQLNTITSGKPIFIPDFGMTFVGINTNNKNSPLSSLAGRQALSYALNVPKLIKARGVQATPANQLLTPSLAGFNPSVPDHVYDLAKAKQLLSTLSNAKQQITFAFFGDTPGFFTELKNEAAAAGFNVKGVNVDNFDSYVTDSLNGKYDLFEYADIANGTDGAVIFSDLLTGNSNYDSPQIDNLLADTGATLNTAQRISDLQQMATIVNQDKPIIPIYTADRIYWKSNSNYVINNDLPDILVNCYLWQTYQH